MKYSETIRQEINIAQYEDDTSDNDFWVTVWRYTETDTYGEEVSGFTVYHTTIDGVIRSCISEYINRENGYIYNIEIWNKETHMFWAEINIK